MTNSESNVTTTAAQTGKPPLWPDSARLEAAGWRLVLGGLPLGLLTIACETVDAVSPDKPASEDFRLKERAICFAIVIQLFHAFAVQSPEIL